MIESDRYVTIMLKVPGKDKRNYDIEWTCY